MKNIVLILLLATIVFAEKQVVSNLAVAMWDANTESDLNHYVVYIKYSEYFFANSTPDTIMSLDLATHWPENTFYENLKFNVTAVDDAGNESGPSNTVEMLFAKARTLVGDFDQNGMVLADDIMRMRGCLGSEIGDFNFFKTADVNGDGLVLADDIMISRGNLGQTLN